LADAMARIHPLLRALMLAGTAFSMLGWISSDILGSPRQLFALGRDGLLPRVLGRIHSRSRAPHVAIMCYAAVTIVLALTESFAELAVFSTLAMAALYATGCAAAWVLGRRKTALAGAPLNFRWLGWAAVLGGASMLALIVLGSWREIVGLLTLVVLSSFAYLVQSRIVLARNSANG
jgi:APA family basic amino acid/polyamine antiporter